MFLIFLVLYVAVKLIFPLALKSAPLRKRLFNCINELRQVKDQVSTLLAWWRHVDSVSHCVCKHELNKLLPV